MNNSLSIVLPIFNEEKNIKNVIYDTFHHIPNYIETFEIIAINDGSTDNTQAILNRLKTSFANLKIVSHEKNSGYGYAIRTGIQSSTREWIFIMDADGQFRINDFETFWMKRQDNDFILGFRKKRGDNLYRILMGNFGNSIASLFLKKRIIDINCGFKLFKRQALTSMSLYSTGGIISFEILYNLLKNNKNRFVQYPINHYPREYGRQTGGNLKTIIKILFEGTRILIK